MNSGFRKAGTAGMIAITLLATLILVAFSPLALRVLSSQVSTNWGQLSEVGQTYGAISALIAALALGGISGCSMNHPTAPASRLHKSPATVLDDALGVRRHVSAVSRRQH